MGFINESGLFKALEQELRESKEPLDCNQLFERPNVREHAKTVSRVSDYLGNLWRKGLVLRVPAPRAPGNKAQWMYLWKDKGPYVRPKPDVSQVVEFTSEMKTLLKRPTVEITEEGSVITITTPHLSIMIRQTS